MIFEVEADESLNVSPNSYISCKVRISHSLACMHSIVVIVLLFMTSSLFGRYVVVECIL